MPASPRFAFTPLSRETLPLLKRWLAAEHVSAWFGPPANADADPLGEQDPVRRFIASLGERPIGLIQSYRWSDVPANAVAVGARPGEIGIDYLIGEAELIGQGIGPAMIEAFLEQVAGASDDISGVRVDVSEENRRSWRCLEKLGFRRERDGVLIGGQRGRHLIYVRAASRGPTPPA